MSVDPRSLQIQIYPAEVLRKKAAPIAKVTDEIRDVATRMIELMREAKGIGLAAPQVGLSWRLFVVEIDPESKRAKGKSDGPLLATNGPEVYINPRFSNAVPSVEPGEEGCLSIPGVYGDVLRPPTITITATGLDGQEFTKTGTGLLARCWQHENDHLDGVLILDRMIAPHRVRNRLAVKDLERGN